MSKRLSIHDPEGKPLYDICIEKDFDPFLDEIRKIPSLKGKRACIVADSNTSVLYADAVRQCLAQSIPEIYVFSFPAGEMYKNLDTVTDLYRFLMQRQFDRSDFLIALGGGVVGDLCGFAAATYLRGIPFIQVPTTLLAQSDSSIGGKTGVDLDGYKNMAGAFYMPRLVYMNVSALKTLSERIYLSGMGEVIKHGLIKDNAFLRFLEESSRKILQRDVDILMELAYGNCRIKGDIVEADPMEKGIRRILNFGHTLGHAIEKQLSNVLYHGECVSIGMAAAGYIGFLKGTLSMPEVRQLCAVLRSFKLPVCADFDHDEALAATKNDKKMQSGQIAFVLLRRFGEAYVDMTVTEEEMAKALSYVNIRGLTV